MSAAQAVKRKKVVADEIPGYDYDEPSDAKSLTRLREREQQERDAGLAEDDEEWLRAACAVLANERKASVAKWRAIFTAHLRFAGAYENFLGDRGANRVPPE